MGRRRDPGLVGPGRVHPPGGGDRRPGQPAGKATWYLATNLPRPGGPRKANSVHPAASLAEITADLRDPALDRAKLQAGQGRAGLGRLPGPLGHRDPPHQALVNCTFSFCWAASFAENPPQRSICSTAARGRAAGERGAARRRTAAGTVLAAGTARGTRLAFPLDRAAALVDCMVQGARLHSCRP